MSTPFGTNLLKQIVDDIKILLRSAVFSPESEPGRGIGDKVIPGSWLRLQIWMHIQALTQMFDHKALLNQAINQRAQGMPVFAQRWDRLTGVVTARVSPRLILAFYGNALNIRIFQGVAAAIPVPRCQTAKERVGAVQIIESTLAQYPRDLTKNHACLRDKVPCLGMPDDIEVCLG